MNNRMRGFALNTPNAVNADGLSTKLVTTVNDGVVIGISVGQTHTTQQLGNMQLTLMQDSNSPVIDVPLSQLLPGVSDQPFYRLSEPFTAGSSVEARLKNAVATGAANNVILTFHYQR